MTTLTVVLAVIAVVSLGVNVYQVVLSRRSSLREGGAHLEAHAFTPFENPKAPNGWQINVAIRNTGGAVAYNPKIWVTDRDGSDLSMKWAGPDSLDPGEPGQIRADLPNAPSGAQHIWISWEDARGVQQRDSGIIV